MKRSQNIKNKLRILGIISLWIPIVWFPWIVYTNKTMLPIMQGMYIGQAVVFLFWAMKETYVYLSRNKKE
jgi:hypothetical protein